MQHRYDVSARHHRHRDVGLRVGRANQRLIRARVVLWVENYQRAATPYDLGLEQHVIEARPDLLASRELHEFARPVGVAREPSRLRYKLFVLDGEQDGTVEADGLAELANRARF